MTCFYMLIFKNPISDIWYSRTPPPPSSPIASFLLHSARVIVAIVVIVVAVVIVILVVVAVVWFIHITATFSSSTLWYHTPFRLSVPEIDCKWLQMPVRDLYLFARRFQCLELPLRQTAGDALLQVSSFGNPYVGWWGFRLHRRYKETHQWQSAQLQLDDFRE